MPIPRIIDAFVEFAGNLAINPPQWRELRNWRVFLLKSGLVLAAGALVGYAVGWLLH